MTGYVSSCSDEKGLGELGLKVFWMREGKGPPSGWEWCGPGTARGGERSVYGTGASVPPGALALEAGPVGGLGGWGAGRSGARGRREATRGNAREALDRRGLGTAASSAAAARVGLLLPDTSSRRGDPNWVLTITPSTHTETNQPTTWQMRSHAPRQPTVSPTFVSAPPHKHRSRFAYG